MKVNNLEIREMVVAKTLEMIISKGLRGWNMVDLAAQTGLAKQTLYRIIGSKEKVIEEVVISQMEYTFGGLDNLINENTDYITIGKKILEESPKFLSAFPRVTLPEIYREYPAIETKALQIQQKLSKRLISFIKRGMDEGIIRDDFKPGFLFDLMRGGVLEHYIRSGLTGTELQSTLQTAFSCFLEGIGKK